MAEVRAWGEVRRARLDAWIADRPVIPYDREIARVWGRLAGNAQQRGRPRPQNVTWVAACCIRLGMPLITLNRKDLADFAAHEGLILLDHADDARSRPPVGGYPAPAPRGEPQGA